MTTPAEGPQPFLSQLAADVDMTAAGNDDGTFNVTLTYDDRTMTIPSFEFGMHAPAVALVLSAILSDAATYDEADGLEDWAAQLGFSQDVSVDAEDEDLAATQATYQRVAEQTSDLQELLGSDYERFLYARPGDPNDYGHMFSTFLGLPPDKSDAPICGARLADDWDGRGKPQCPECATRAAH